MLQCCKHRAAYLHSGEMTLVWLNLVSEYVLLMAQLLTKGDRMPPLVIIVPAHESCVCATTHHTSSARCDCHQSAGRGLATACLPGGVVTGAALRHCHAEAGPQLLFSYLFSPRWRKSGGGCLQLTCGPVSRGEAARHNGSTFIPLWESVLCHLGNLFYTTLETHGYTFILNSTDPLRP